MSRLSRRFTRNRVGRDFVVGDVHGMFGALGELLAAAEFDAGRDRLFSVGDLIDRGPGSREALDWLARPWFHPVRGNHEQFLLDSNDPSTRDLWIRYNGGAWWLDCPPGEREAFRAACAALPIAIEIQTAKGRVGVVHADAPRSNSWPDFLARLESNDERVLEHALWSRERVSAGGSERVTGVELVLCGHTPTTRIVEAGNVRFIDTGAVYTQFREARLTMIEIEPDWCRPLSVATGAGATTQPGTTSGSRSVRTDAGAPRRSRDVSR